MTEREVVNAKKRELYKTRKESGLCTMCGKPREATAINITRCEACRAMRKKGYVAKKDFEKYRLKRELKKNSKELEVYKKALELACYEIEERDCSYYRKSFGCKNNCEMWDVCSANMTIEDYFLMEAREE